MVREPLQQFQSMIIFVSFGFICFNLPRDEVLDGSSVGVVPRSDVVGRSVFWVVATVVTLKTSPVSPARK